jgi:hypothetical protein
MRFFRHALLYSVDTFIAGYRSHGDQKAVLYMDKYEEEARSVIAEELKQVGHVPHPLVPTALKIDLDSYRKYLALKILGHYDCFVEEKISLESTCAHLLTKADTLRDYVTTLTEEARTQQEMRLQFEIAARNDNARMQALSEKLKEMESSLSWSITKPLRWLGDTVRGNSKK